jgi:hypothetical protein
MWQAHSFLWHYLWLAPATLCWLLGAALWRRGTYKRYPFFFAYLVLAPIEQFCLYAFDLSSKISAVTWWYTFWTGTILEGVLKFGVVAELLRYVLSPWPSVAKLVRNLVSGAGVLFVLLAAVIAAFAAPDNVPRLVGSAHVLSHTLYLIEAGLIVSIFLLAAFFHIPWERSCFGIALGFGVTWCQHAAIWALVTEGVVRNRGWQDFANMATYHLSVLIWYYYLLVPEKSASSKPKDADKRPPQDPPTDPPSSSSGGSPENHEEALEDWNRELERLIHQ